MRILITGATGFIGHSIVKALETSEHALVLTSRQMQAKASIHDWRIIDFAKAQRPKDWIDLVAGVDIVINTVGIFSQTRTQSFEALHSKGPIALFEASKKAGVKRIIQISALGTEDTSTSPYHLSKKRADDALAGLGIDHVILRPSLIIGGQGESWALFKALAHLPIVPVIGDGRQSLQPVAIDDVVRAVVGAVSSAEAVGRRINLVGVECLTQEAYLLTLSSWMGDKRPSLLHIPYALAYPLASLGRLLGDIPLNRDAITMLAQARRYEGVECKRALGFTPIGVNAFLSQQDPHSGERIAARQYFLRPLLRIALAFMWIMAGIASIFLYPQEDGLALLAKLGLTGQVGIFALYGAALTDGLLGLALLARYRIRLVGFVQIALTISYTLALSWVAPILWSDPFGPLTKNIPIIVATLIMISWEEK